MSAQPPSTPRIEDLRARLRLDPKARHFYPLAEELRKLGQRDEAEKILREGLTHHPAYLSAWVSLGRVLAEKGAHQEAIESLTKALALDPGNVVCANLLASSYLAVGERVEALKKLKLVRAVMPGDEVDEQIAALENEIASGGPRAAGFAPAAAEAPPPAEPLQPAAGAEVPSPPPSPAEATPEVMEAVPEAVPAEPAPAAAAEPAPDERADAATAAPSAEPAPAPERAPAAMESAEASKPAVEPSGAAGWEPATPSPFLTEPEEEAAPPLPPEAADVLPEEVFPAPTEAEHRFGEPVAETPIADALASPQEQMEDAVPESTPLFRPEEPFAAEEPTPAPAAESSAPEIDEAPEAPAAIADEQTATLTMADLYAKQGHDAAARDIYERVLERDPSNQEVRARLAALAGGSSNAERDRRLAAASRLERWLEKVGRREL